MNPVLLTALPSVWAALRKVALDPRSGAGLEMLAQALGRVDVSDRREEVFPDVFDYRLDDEFRTTKARGRDRPLHQVRRLCVHQTAVKFGTSRRQRAAWRRRLERGEAHPLLQGLLLPDGSNIDELSERAALHWRMREQTPYHDKSLLCGDVLLSERATRYTWHGNGANAESVGIGLEGHYPGLVRDHDPGRHHGLDGFTIETHRAAMRLSVIKRREEGCPLEEVEHHRQHSRARLGDAGEGVHREVVIPVARELGLKIVHGRTTGSGRVVTTEWDPDSPFGPDGRPR